MAKKQTPEKEPPIVVFTIDQSPEVVEALNEFKQTMDSAFKQAGMDGEVKITNVNPEIIKNDPSKN